MSTLYEITCEIDFCYGHRLLNHRGKCRHLHGHNGRAVITLRSDSLNAEGMVLDFSEVKCGLRNWIDEHWDHKMLLFRDDPAIAWMRSQGEAVCVLELNPTAENLARLLFEQAVAKGFPVESVRLWETPRCSAVYRGDDGIGMT